MKLRTAMGVLLGLFLAFLGINLFLSFLLQWKHIIYPDNCTGLIIQVLQIYSVNISVIFSLGFFNEIKPNAAVNIGTFIWAMALSFVWNVLTTTGLILILTDSSYTYNQLTNYLKNVPGSGSFLIAGVVGYFFTKKEGKS